MADIDAALSKALTEGWTEIEIHLDYYRYRDLLEIKGLAHDDETGRQLTQEEESAGARPLKAYRGYPLILNWKGWNSDHGSKVCGRKPSGHLAAWAIPNR